MAAKRSQQEANYRLGGTHCGACEYFIDENEGTETGKCKLVEGVIGEVMGCDLFERAKGEKGNGPASAQPQDGRYDTGQKTGMARLVRKKS
jgi:hypothetical protein